MHFPRGIPPDVLATWNGCPANVLTERLHEVFCKSRLLSEKPVDELDNKILHRIFPNETIMIPKSHPRLISHATDVFKSGIDNDWVNWGLSDPGPAIAATPAMMYELGKDAVFKKMFMSLSANLEGLCNTQGQIINFAKKHKNRIGTNGNFFLTKKDWKKPAIGDNGDTSNLFVARVYVFSDGLYIYVSRFERGSVWSAADAHRLVVPQLTV